MDGLAELLTQAKGLGPALNAVGVAGLLILFIAGLATKWIVWGWQYKEQERRIERLEGKVDDWKSIALTSLSTGDRLADHALSQSALNPKRYGQT